MLWMREYRWIIARGVNCNLDDDGGGAGKWAGDAEFCRFGRPFFFHPKFCFKLSQKLKLRSPAGKLLLLHSSFSRSSFSLYINHLRLRGHSLVYFCPVALLHSRFVVTIQLLYDQHSFFKTLMAESNGDATTANGKLTHSQKTFSADLSTQVTLKTHLPRTHPRLLPTASTGILLMSLIIMNTTTTEIQREGHSSRSMSSCHMSHTRCP
jgi:hypothetical protein